MPFTQSLWTAILEFKGRTLSTPSGVSAFWSNFQVLISPVQLPKIKIKLVKTWTNKRNYNVEKYY